MAAYPKGKVEFITGKPRKGAFEVEISVPGLSKQTLFSKLETYGPEKVKTHLPDPHNFVNQALKEFLEPLQD